jgi:hypothetical protein
MDEREQAITLILAALVVSSGFIILAQRNRVNELETLFVELKMDNRYTQAQYELLQSSFEELDEQASEYRAQLIQLRQDIDKLERYEETWRHYRDFYENILLENARLNGILLEREYGENITLPMVEARKEDFHIGDTVAFDVESEIPLYGSYFTVFDNEGLLVWEGDPLSNWVEIQDFWVPPYYGQTAYLDPMIITEDYPLGNWTWAYYFGDYIEIDGWFMVNEALDDVITTGPEGDFWESVERPPADVANVAEKAVEPSIHQSYLDDEGRIPSELARDRTNYSLIWLIFISVTIGFLLVLRGK